MLMVALAFVATLVICPGAYAQEEEENAGSDTWKFHFMPYIWAVSLSGDMTVRGVNAELDASFGDILSNSDSIFAFSGFVEARKGNWGGYMDGTYIKLGTNDSMVGPLVVDTTTEMALFEFGALYRVAKGHWGNSGPATSEQPGRRWSVDVLAGGRFTSQDNQITFKTAPGTPRVDLAESWTDPIIGGRILADLSRSRKLDFRLKGDIGGFGVGSDFTWQALAMVGYNFKLFKTDSAVTLGYRALYQDFETGSGTSKYAWNVTQHGPIIGLDIGW
jgi:hypothetical protein